MDRNIKCKVLLCSLDLPEWFGETIMGSPGIFTREFLATAILNHTAFSINQLYLEGEYVLYMKHLLRLYECCNETRKFRACFFLFILICRMFDTYTGHEFIRTHQKVRDVIMAKVNYHSNMELDKVQREAEFIRCTFEPNKNWLARQLNLE